MTDFSNEKMCHCQLHSLPLMPDIIQPMDKILQRGNRLKRFSKRRWRYIVNLFSEFGSSAVKKSSQDEAVSANSNRLESGDIVRVRSKKEIQSTLNRWNQLRGCSFMEEMLPFCGTNQKVFKRVEKFLDERDYLMKKCKGIVILHDVYCSGTIDFGSCDRTCFFFWREEWLEKI
ncbi:hypothetical protein [Desulfococcus sp.]|uniref:hypothetical protein n=1 Tax=Desulfococcus sp. TaxID=2025834 RepID=UPI003593FBE5